MKKSIFKKGLMCLGLCLSLLGVGTLSSCSAFFGEDTYDGYLIENVVTSTDSNGNTILTIYFTDDTVDPITITLAQGSQGEEGVGIEDITYVSTDSSVTLTITYTDDRDPTVVTIPIFQGEAGVGISNVVVGEDENGDITICFEYTNGTSSDTFTIPSGTQFTGRTSWDDSNAGYIIITLETTNGDDISFTIPNNGIENIDFYGYDEEGNYVLEVTYSDGDVSYISLPVPNATEWFAGRGTPSETTGDIGDFYLDVYNGNIYYKEEDGWQLLYSLGSNTETETPYYVYFYADTEEGEYFSSYGNARWTESDCAMFAVVGGSTLDLEDFPTIEKEGYVFSGWYTDIDNVNSGQFTDLTVIEKDIELYARWVEE